VKGVVEVNCGVGGVMEDKNGFSALASDLGFAPGEWPSEIRVKFDEERDLVYVFGSPVPLTGWNECFAMEYSRPNGDLLTVWND
jgi:hypothetical protein